MNSERNGKKPSPCGMIVKKMKLLWLRQKEREPWRERIIEMAREHRVPIQEDPSLVEILSKMELNEQIPEELYGVVAEVLAFVYRVDERVKEEMKRES